jgi:hypothetical protein
MQSPPAAAHPAPSSLDDEPAPRFRSRKPWIGVAVLVLALVLIFVWLMQE